MVRYFHQRLNLSPNKDGRIIDLITGYKKRNYKHVSNSLAWLALYTIYRNFHAQMYQYFEFEDANIVLSLDRRQVQ